MVCPRICQETRQRFYSGAHVTLTCVKMRCTVYRTMTANELAIYCLSLSHKNTPVDVRKDFAFTANEAAAFLAGFCVRGGDSASSESAFATGAVLVTTCNRTELYFAARNNDNGNRHLAHAQQLLARFKRQDERRFRAYCFSYAGEGAVRHLFAVASGLDSMVLGENEVLGQVREAYKASCAIGCADFSMHCIFQRALSCAKRIKTETILSKATESIATLAVKELMAFRAQQRFASTEAQVAPFTVLLIGASGQMGERIMRDLAERSGVQVFATVRRHHGLPDLPNVQHIPYDDRYRYLDHADVVVSATKSPHYTVSYDSVAASLRTQKQRLFLDLAVPSDIEPDVQSLAGVALRNVDCFTRLAQTHNEQKRQGAVQADIIVTEELDAAVKELLFHAERDFVQDFSAQVATRSGRQLLYDMRRAATAVELGVLMALWHRMHDAAPSGGGR